MRTIRAVIRYENNMVTVFDEQGEQIPEYQSQYEEVRERILGDAPPAAIFAHGFAGDGEPRKVNREEW